MIARVTHAAIAEQMEAIVGEGSFGKLSGAASGRKIDAMLIAGSDNSGDA
jgi:hypothetical protein